MPHIRRCYSMLLQESVSRSSMNQSMMALALIAFLLLSRMTRATALLFQTAPISALHILPFQPPSQTAHILFTPLAFLTVLIARTVSNTSQMGVLRTMLMGHGKPVRMSWTLVAML